MTYYKYKAIAWFSATKMKSIIHLVYFRLYLAALHFNENSKRDQAVTRDGTPMYGISYPKSRKGAPIAKEVKV